jgi:uncharacterized protein (TIGR02231 family)
MQTMSLPVTKVTVMEDRAQVERVGTVTLSGGVARLELGGLPLVAVDRSLRLEVQGATLLDGKLLRRHREQPKGGIPADATALRKRVEELEETTRRHADGVARLTVRQELAANARADLLGAVSLGAGAGQLLGAQWALKLEEVSQRQRDLDEEARVARRDQAHAATLLAQARHALQAAEETERALECLLALTLDGSGVAHIKVSYQVPCAVWRPAYRATLREDQVKLEAEGVVWQRTGEDWDNVELWLSTARPTLGTTPPALHEDVIQLRDKHAVEKKVVDVAMREEVIQTAGEGGGSAEMPGLDDGGEARLLRAPGVFSIKGNGQPHRLPLFQFETRAVVERVCTPELSSLAFVVARFPNQGGAVLLAGPVDLVRQSGFVGRAQLKFAAPGETVRLSFGNEDGVQVVRERNDKQDTALLTGRKTTTTLVKLHVSNTSAHHVRLVLEERVPVSEVKEIEVQVLGRECSPQASNISKDGVARLELELAPNATQTARFAWELSAASKVAGV